jgi:hypothetical protein
MAMNRMLQNTVGVAAVVVVLGAAGVARAQAVAQPPVLDSDLAHMEAEIQARSPEVAPGLRLPAEDMVLAMDEYGGARELVALAQTDSGLNKNTAHNILRGTINPVASQHQMVELKGKSAAVQLHTARPVFYVRLGENLPEEAPEGAVRVNTHGAGGGGEARDDSTYVIVRADVRTDVRVIASFKLTLTGKVSREEDVCEADVETLPGGHWLRITPKQPLLEGEYAVMELLDARNVNLSVWDFGVHTGAAENRDVIRPEVKRPRVLQTR